MTETVEAVTEPATLKSRLYLNHLEPWSVMKNVFIYSFVMAAGFVVMMFFVWTAFTESGLMELVDGIIEPLTASDGEDGMRVSDFIDTKRFMALSVFIACVSLAIVTAMSSLGAFVYNIVAKLVGGIEVTLSQLPE